MTSSVEFTVEGTPLPDAALQQQLQQLRRRRSAQLRLLVASNCKPDHVLQFKQPHYYCGFIYLQKKKKIALLFQPFAKCTVQCMLSDIPRSCPRGDHSLRFIKNIICMADKRDTQADGVQQAKRDRRDCSPANSKAAAADDSVVDIIEANVDDRDHPDELLLAHHHQRWSDFLKAIRQTISARRASPWRVFLSYAWEVKEEDNELVQMWLQRVKATLQIVGAEDVFLDLTDIDSSLPDAMKGGIEKADVVIIACTPRYAERVKTESSPAAFELRTVLQEVAKRRSLRVMPVLLRGSFDESVPGVLHDFVVRDATKRSFEDLMTELSPLGIVPGILGCNIGGENNVQYTRLLQHFQLTLMPPSNPAFCGREDVLQALHSKLEASCHVAVTQQQTLSGLGGIGKTQTAIAFAYKFCNEYVFCRWLLADSKQTFESELELLARALKVKVDSVASHVWRAQMYEKLQQVERWLLIFDNVETSESVLPFLPKTQQPGQHILMTSRSQRFASVVDLDVLKPDEVEELLGVLLSGSSLSNFTTKEASQLGERLGRLPLALSQAAAYLRTHGINIPSYLQLLDKIPEDLLSKHGGDDLVSYPLSVRNTWLLSISKIQMENADAIVVLDSCAWMHADDIPLVWFEQESILGNVGRVTSALEVLRKYSMVSNGASPNTIKIHRLVQDVVLLGQSAEQKKQVLDAQTKALTALCALDLKTSADVAMARALVPHMHRMIEVSLTWQKSIYAVASIIERLAWTYMHLGQPARQKELLEKALALAETQCGPDHVLVAKALVGMADAHSLDQPGKAKELLERALKIQEKHYGSNHLEVARTLHDLGIEYGLLDQPDKQKELLERALKIKVENYGPSHFEVAKSMRNLSNAYESLGQADKAKELLEGALKILEPHYGPNHYYVAFALRNLATACASLHQHHRQKELLERVLKINEQHYGPNHFEVAAALHGLGNAYGCLGQSDKKKELLEQALKIDEEHYGPNNFQVALTLHDLGQACCDLGLHAEAKQHLERAIAIRHDHFGSDHRFTQATRLLLSKVFKALGLGEPHVQSTE